MRQTDEQRDETARFRQRLAGVNPMFRVVADQEGWPVSPGRFGQIESAVEPGALFVYTASRRMVAKLLAIPGVRRHQTGEREARLRFPADDPACLRAICDLIRVRRRRPPTAGNPAALARARAGGRVMPTCQIRCERCRSRPST